MHYQLATRFGRNAHQISGREPLDNEALYRHVPSIFAREAHDSRSERYVYVPTIDIVEGLRREGWSPFFAVQSVPRDGSRHGHAKHMLRLRRDDGIGKPEAAEVIIVNSHDLRAWADIGIKHSTSDPGQDDLMPRADSAIARSRR